jgi:hypothetical protein
MNARRFEWPPVTLVETAISDNDLEAPSQIAGAATKG